MPTPSSAGVQAFALAVEAVLRDIRQLRKDLDLTSILAWANAQALISSDHDTLHFLDQAYRAVQRNDPLPWLQADQPANLDGEKCQ